jgi:hypothetical protein
MYFEISDYYLQIDVKNLHIEEIVNILENSEIEGTHDEVALDMPPCPINCLQLIIDEVTCSYGRHISYYHTFIR